MALKSDKFRNKSDKFRSYGDKFRNKSDKFRKGMKGQKLKVTNSGTGTKNER